MTIDPSVRFASVDARLARNPLRFSLSSDQRIYAVLAWLKGEAPKSVAYHLGVRVDQLVDLADLERWPTPKAGRS